MPSPRQIATSLKSLIGAASGFQGPGFLLPTRTKPDRATGACCQIEFRLIQLNCLIQLSPPHREVIDLVYYHQKSIDEIAEITGAPQNTVKTRMFYARRRIAELMSARGIERAIV
jgi:DNA-directed RNA polymerase specialized sigma24 family protein